MNADDNDDDIPWGTDPASLDGTALQSESNQLPAGDRRNPFCVPRRWFLPRPPALLRVLPPRPLRLRWRQG